MQQLISLLQIVLLAQHFSGTTMPIIRSSRVLFRWLMPVVFGALVFTLPVWCRAVGCVSGLRDAALQILLLAQHLSGTIMPIIRSSRVLYRWLLPVVFGALVFTLPVCCRAVGCVSGLRYAALQILLLAQHFSGTIMPIIRSSRVLDR